MVEHFNETRTHHQENWLLCQVSTSLRFCGTLCVASVQVERLRGKHVAHLRARAEIELPIEVTHPELCFEPW